MFTQLARTIATLAVVLAVFIPLEARFALSPARVLYPGVWTNLGWCLISGLVPLVVLGPPAALLAWGVHTILPGSVTGAAAHLPLWARMACAVAIGEIGFYWGHRWSHEWRWLWRFHAVHHSAEHLSVLVNGRAHPVDMMFTRLCGLVLLYATGFAAAVGPDPALVPAVVLAVSALWSYLLHANVRWRFGPFEHLVASPAFHHWHHSRDDHRDHNYAPMLPVVDRLFGTLYLPSGWPSAYGIAAPMPATLLGQLLEPFAPIPPLPSPPSPASP